MRGRLKPGVVVGLALALALAGSRAAAQDAGLRIRQLDADARAEENLGRPEVAIQKYQEVLKLDPNLAAAYNNIGRIYYAQHRFQEAVEPLKRAAQLDPKLEAPHAQLAFCFFQMGDYVAAQREFQSSLKISPSDEMAKLYLARSMVELQDVSGALPLLEQLRRVDPNNPEILYSLGNLYAGLAVSTLDSVQKADPNSYVVDLLQGKYAEVKQAFPEAAEHYRQAIEKSPDLEELYYCYAHALWASGEFDHALEQYHHALALNPFDYRSNWEAARIILPQDPNEALRLANRALELKPRLAPALTVRGRALAALEKYPEAVQDFQLAASVAPSDSANHFQLARTYAKMGRADDAKAETAIYERMSKEAHIPEKDSLPVTPN